MPNNGFDNPDMYLQYSPLLFSFLVGIAFSAVANFAGKNWCRDIWVQTSVRVSSITAFLLTALLVGAVLSQPIWHDLRQRKMQPQIKSHSHATSDNWSCRGHEIDSYYQSVQQLENLVKLEWLLDHYATFVLVPAVLAGLVCHKRGRTTIG